MIASSAVRPYLLCLVVFAVRREDELHEHGSKMGWALIVERFPGKALWAFEYFESMQRRIMRFHNEEGTSLVARRVSLGTVGKTAPGLKRKELATGRY